MMPMQQQTQRQNRGRRQNFQNANNGNICKFFANGNCSKGQNCNWTHLIPTAGMGYGGPQKNMNRGVFRYGGRGRYDPSMQRGGGRYQNVQNNDAMQDNAYMNVRSASELEGE